jgi:undecaprenyl diphosphate synthase
MTELFPRHVAIIMDGNGRWARERGLMRIEGHRAGVGAVRRCVEHCARIDIPFLTLFAFSTENWARPALEVGSLMALLDFYLEAELTNLEKNRIELCTIGDLDALPRALVRRVRHVKNLTKGLDGMRLTLALSYGGRDEILRATRALAGRCASDDSGANEFSAVDFERCLDTGSTPPPDLIIRTGGEQRLSNFMLWQAAYAELYFTPVKWPEFNEDDLDKALCWFANRDRRFGEIKEDLGRVSAASGS